MDIHDYTLFLIRKKNVITIYVQIAPDAKSMFTMFISYVYVIFILWKIKIVTVIYSQIVAVICIVMWLIVLDDANFTSLTEKNRQ